MLRTTTPETCSHRGSIPGFAPALLFAEAVLRYKACGTAERAPLRRLGEAPYDGLPARSTAFADRPACIVSCRRGPGVPTPAEVTNQLSTYGLTTMSANQFHQRGTAGFCRGASLDWIRRVLNQTGRLAYNYDRNTTSGARRQAIMQSIQDRYDPATKTQQASLRRIGSAIDTETKAIDELAVKLRGMSRDTDQYDTLRKDWASRMETQDRRTANYAQLVHSANTQGIVPYWASLSKEFDQAVQSAKPGSKKSFASIRAIDGRPATTITGDPSLVSAINSTVDLMSDGTCLLWTFESRGSAAHAIAIHQETSAQRYLFDPNYGVFVATGPEAMVKIKKAVLYLYKIVYPGNDKYEFTLFSRT